MSAEAVRDGDKDRYLASLFAPDGKRPHMLALYAFNLEIARIRDVVSEPQIGLIRQQWWLDTLDALYASEPPDHPVAQALQGTISEGNLPKHALRNLVLAREFDLYADPMPDLESLEAYLGETSSALIQMAALILAGERANACAEAAGLAGVAYGLARLLAAGMADRYLPKGMTQADAKAHASRRLTEARALLPRLPQDALPAFLPVSLTGLYLSGGMPSQFRRQLTMWWAARRDRF